MAHPFRAILAFLTFSAALLSPAFALESIPPCSQPLTSGLRPQATDCLHILRTAVGAAQCDPACVCRPAGSQTTTSLDALTCLQKSVLLPVLLDCGCPGSSLEVVDFSGFRSFRFSVESSFGYCVVLDSPLAARIDVAGNGDLVFQATLLVEGDRGAGDECRDDIYAIAEQAVDCAIEREAGPRVLTADEVGLVSRAFSRVQIDSAPDPECKLDYYIDVCSEERVEFNGGWWNDLPCSFPRLQYDQVHRIMDLLMVLLADTAMEPSPQERTPRGSVWVTRPRESIGYRLPAGLLRQLREARTRRGSKTPHRAASVSRHSPGNVRGRQLSPACRTRGRHCRHSRGDAGVTLTARQSSRSPG